MSKVQKLFSNSIANITARVLNGLLQIVCLPVLIKIYGKGQCGLIAIAMSLNTFIAILQIGMPTGIPKFVAEWIGKGETRVMEKATRTVFSFYLIVATINLVLILWIRNFANYFKILPDQIDTLKSLLIVTAIVSFISIPVNFVDQLLTGVQEIAFG